MLLSYRSITAGINGGSELTAQRMGLEIMPVTLNERAFEHAKALINEGKYVFDDRDAWSEYRPTAQQENEFIRLHGYDEYAKWYLGINDEHREHTKGRYEFPYGDFEKVHRGGLITAESRAGQYKHFDIENAAHQLHQMIDARERNRKP
ncbi:MAG: hypothetical protein WBX25_21900 [Rhodomicrobium sp.]